MSGVKVLRVSLPARLVRAATRCCLDQGATGTSEEAPKAGRIALTVYAPEAQFPTLRRALRQLLTRLAPTERFQCRAVLLSDDWRLKWTEYLTPVALTPTLTLVPVAVDAPIQATRPATELYLEAGLVFGFGEHPTTRMAARWLEEHAKEKSVFDLGSGSGVLALIAERGGASAVLGVDIDLESVELARRNAQRNASLLCRFECTPIEAVAQNFDVVVANVDAQTLRVLVADVCRCLKQRGKLALTGILREQQDDVVTTYAAHGVELALHATEDDWVLLVGHFVLS